MVGSRYEQACKKCGMRFEDEKRFEIYKGVHGRKPKVSQYGKDMPMAPGLWVVDIIPRLSLLKIHLQALSI